MFGLFIEFNYLYNVINLIITTHLIDSCEYDSEHLFSVRLTRHVPLRNEGDE